ncbi:FAD-dependent oxidoreductase [Sphingomonas crocodyli]|uniref:NADH:flavin oxidoreductase n=1 Tax=Sphingomonas crocodyli TaxID=1979270 RepID=A0A437LWX5_9SPHN|nr:FAD-dependent oxidoreductase [Sphingomonas crocodyli]RVT89883.1 NADH:flavin oxidoreductase [Sphingomonas crocodyli]
MTNPHYPHLFSPFTVAGVELKNRLVMAPMSTSLGGVDGAVTPSQIAFYRERALGGFGLIIVEFTCVDPKTGRTEEHQLSLDSRRNLDGHYRLVETIHAAGAKAFLQLQHGGRFAKGSYLADGVVRGPMEVRSRKDPNKIVVAQMTDDEIQHLVEAFGRSAALASEAGYDGIELHGAHGYLLSQFLSPFSNQRDDKWGGDFERRLAFPTAVIKAVKAAIGDKPLCFRISADEFLKGGLSVEDNALIVPHLVAAGADMLHASTGRGPEAFDKVMEPMSAPEGWRLPYAKKLREAANVPMIGVGQIRWPETGEAALIEGDCDLVALGRPSLTDPAWPKKAEAGLRDEIRPCTSCNWCIAPDNLHRIVCAENPRTGSELDADFAADLGLGRKAVVVGAGPGGMAAALMLDQAGFQTTLHEASDELGGGLIASATPPGKDKLFWYRDYLVRRLAKSRVAVRRGHRVTADEIAAEAPDLVFVAAGTTTRPMSIDGIDDPMVLDAYELLMGHALPGVPAGGTAIVYGGGETGCEAAEYMAEHGARVVLVTRSGAHQLARSAEIVYRLGLVARINANPAIEVVAESEIVRITDGEVTVRGKDGDTRVIEAARLLMAQGRDPLNKVADDLVAAGVRCYLVGDSRKVGRIGDAVHTAYQAMRALAADRVPLQPLAC